MKCLGVRLAGDLIGDVDERGEPIVDDTALILLNAHHESLPFVMPETRAGQAWKLALETSGGTDVPEILRGGDQFPLRDRSLALFFTRGEGDVSLPTSPSEVEGLRREARRPEPAVPSHQPGRRPGL